MIYGVIWYIIWFSLKIFTLVYMICMIYNMILLKNIHFCIYDMIWYDICYAMLSYMIWYDIWYGIWYNMKIFTFVHSYFIREQFFVSQLNFQLFWSWFCATHIPYYPNERWPKFKFSGIYVLNTWILVKHAKKIGSRLSSISTVIPIISPPTPTPTQKRM